MLLLTALLVGVLVQAVHSNPPQSGPYQVTKTICHVGGFQQGKQTAIAMVPTNTSEVFPLISFSHGDYGGGDFLIAYDPMLREIASHGFVVVAHESCFPTCEDNQYKDQLRVLDWAVQAYQNGTYIKDQALRMVDFKKKFGVGGHSTGGRSTLQSATMAQKYNIAAGVGFNPDPMVDQAKNNQCPLAIFTGTWDVIEPVGSAKDDFVAAHSPKVFANMVNETHLEEVLPHPRWSVYAAAWWQIYINFDHGYYYNLIYGSLTTHDSLCGGFYPMKECILSP